MINKFIIFLFIVLGWGINCLNPALVLARPLNIVTTQTIFADLVQQIAQQKARVKAIASPKYNIHFIEPKPSDVRAVANADLYIHAGLDLEMWSDPLLEAAGQRELFKNGPRNVDLSENIRLLNVPHHPPSRSQGDIHLLGNPHYHMNPENAKQMIATILKYLKQVDPSNASFYEKNAQQFLSQLDHKIVEWKKLCHFCRDQEIISYHDDIAYLADFLRLKVNHFLEPKPGIPPTPQHLKFLEEYIKEQQLKMIVLPTYYSRIEADKLAKRMNIKVVLIGQGVKELPGTDNFFSFFDFNVKQISEVLNK